MPERVIYVVRSWPRLSQTFIVNEVLALERRGLELVVCSLVRSGEVIVQPQVADVRAEVRYLDDLEHGARSVRRQLASCVRAPVRSLRALLECLRHPRLAAGYGECSALECLRHATSLAAVVREIRAHGDEPVRVHAHFAHDPALVGMLAARLTGVPFSFTAHARDLFEIPPESLAARAREATAVVTCCAVNAAYIESVVPPGDRPPVRVIHHGVDLRRFAPSGHPAPGPVPLLVSVGRLVEKKGFPDLLRALRLVKERGLRFQVRVLGDGPLLGELVRLRDELGLTGDVELPGAEDSDAVVRALRDATAFALTPRVLADGDRDGIPNVLVEAMACGLPVVTTTAGGITELVAHDVNGLLAEPGDVPGIADSLARVLTDAGSRTRLGAAARQTVERGYDTDEAASCLERVLRAGAPVPEAAR
ncbi:glycosyltransferase family 4 protein [Nocardioides panacis]|uniref:Glycosyltransferase family 4 protein n=1 Tax=Nocardioides panacis TaxID=2849501 RepID=A0A975Y032_9ACTN|nr:glycosyltransferase family 4 protein [Nocardioides panacis]QWZ08030.1 glycosyltransferase family 4 protein [Nocardioides panacis]